MPHSVSRFGLGAVIRCSAASVTLGQFSGGINGPLLPFVNHLQCCDAARHSGLSQQLTYPFQDERQAGEHRTNTISW